MKKIVCIFFILAAVLFNKAQAYEQTLIIFDASVSMLEPFGVTQKYIAAADAAKRQLGRMNPQASVGLRTIGITIDSALISLLTNPDNLCKATKLIVPISAYNIENINKKLDAIFPMGMTPLTYALNMAVNYDFDTNANPKHIILITDGAESCNADPCNFIKNIMQQRNDIKIDVIAITVNQDDYNQLKCLTDNTQGKIITVNSNNELDYAFSTVFQPENSSGQYQYMQQKPDTIPLARPAIRYKNYLIETSQ